ncbi:MAG: metallophosphoesterase [Myxococcota bacterium]
MSQPSWHPSLRRHFSAAAMTLSVLVGSLWVSGSAEAAIYNGPYMMELSTSSVKILWESDVMTAARIDYGTTRTYGQTQQVPAVDFFHAATLSNLAPNTTYYYAVVEESGDKREGSFTTAPPKGTPFNFAAYGDNRSNPDEHTKVATAILSHKPRLVVTTGDYVEYAGVIDQWHNQFFTPAAPMLASVPILPSIGNHDSNVGHPRSPVDVYFPPPNGKNYYSRDIGDIHFVVVDSNVSYGTSSNQYAWLEQDLASTTQPVILVAHHHPVYSSGNHGSTSRMDDTLRVLYERYGVTAVLNGHDHMYERSYRNGIHYFVLGGGGASLYDPNDSRNPYAVKNEKTLNYGHFKWSNGVLTLDALRPDGSLIETVVLTGAGAREAAELALKQAQELRGEYDESLPLYEVSDASMAGCGGSMTESEELAAGMVGALVMVGLGAYRLRRRKENRS